MFLFSFKKKKKIWKKVNKFPKGIGLAIIFRNF